MGLEAERRVNEVVEWEEEWFKFDHVIAEHCEESQKPSECSNN